MKGRYLQHAPEANSVEMFVERSNFGGGRYVFGCHDGLFSLSSNNPGLQLVNANRVIDKRFWILYDSMFELYDMTSTTWKTTSVRHTP